MEALPGQADAGTQHVTVAAGADLAIVAEIEGRSLGDGGVGRKADDCAVACLGDIAAKLEESGSAADVADLLAEWKLVEAALSAG